MAYPWRKSSIIQSFICVERKLYNSAKRFLRTHLIKILEKLNYKLAIIEAQENKFDKLP